MSNYEWVKAFVDCGVLSWEYQTPGSDRVGRMEHDESVHGWSDQEIIDTTGLMLGISRCDHDVIEVIHR